MSIRRISTDSSLHVRVPPGHKLTGASLSLHKDIDPVEESCLHIDLSRRRSECFLWAYLNLIVLLVVLLDVFKELVDSNWLWLMNKLVLLVCSCNLMYYAYNLYKLETKAAHQRGRIRRVYSPKSVTAKPEQFELIKVSPKVVDRPPTESAPANTSGLNESYKGSFIESTVNFSETIQNCTSKLIYSAKELKQYLIERRQARENEFVSSSEDLSILNDSGNEFWSGRRRNVSNESFLDVSPILRRSEYQTSANTSDNSVSSSPVLGCTNQEFFDNLWNKYGIHSCFFIYWVSNFRMWMSKYVLGRIVSEINLADTGLRALTLSGLSLGSISLDTLVDAARNPSISHQIPSLAFLLPYLKVSPKQEYVVNRIKALAQGNGMNDYKWNSGGHIDGKPFERDLPTDAHLLTHIFSTYLDQQLPLSPVNSDSSKPFSSYYFAKDTKNLRQDKICLIQSSANPPHYCLYVDGSIEHVPAGRNNLFYAIILFLYHINIDHQGMLGRISLGKHGINMLWIIDRKDV